MKVWIWVIVIVVVLVGAYFLLKGNKTSVEPTGTTTEAGANVSETVGGATAPAGEPTGGEEKKQ